MGDIFGYRGCFATGHPGHMCIDINIMHMLFGIFMVRIDINIYFELALFNTVSFIYLMHPYLSFFLCIA